MRLICPNCGAQYEVPVDVIPAEGRDVQCSACSSTWFQNHPDHDAALADEVDAPSVEPVAPPPEPKQEDVDNSESAAEQEEPAAPMPKVEPRSIDPEVSDVLRQEAEFEATARAQERSQTLESQPDLGLEEPSEDEAGRRAREARMRMARMRGETVAPQVAVAATTATAGSRRDLLPDIEEINSTLRSSGERRKPAEATDANLAGSSPKIKRKRGGFRRGFLTIVILALIAGGAYVFGPQLSKTVPSAAPYVEQYTQHVESARQWLSGSVDRGLAWLDQMASENL